MKATGHFEESFEVEFSRTPEGFVLAESQEGRWRGVGGTETEALERLLDHWASWLHRVVEASERVFTRAPYEVSAEPVHLVPKS